MIWGEVLDQIDRKILRHLQRDASGTTAELANDVGLSLSACAKRVARLKNDGTISAITAKLDPKKFPKPVSAAVMVTLYVVYIAIVVFSSGVRRRRRAIPPARNCRAQIFR